MSKESKTVPREIRLKIGKRIAETRNDLGKTQAQVGEHLDLTPQAVDRWEQGHSTPRGATLIRLAEFLGVRAEWIMTGNGTRRPPTGTIEDDRYAEFVRKAQMEGASPEDLERAWTLYKEALRLARPGSST